MSYSFARLLSKRSPQLLKKNLAVLSKSSGGCSCNLPNLQGLQRRKKTIHTRTQQATDKTDDTHAFFTSTDTPQRALKKIGLAKSISYISDQWYLSSTASVDKRKKGKSVLLSCADLLLDLLHSAVINHNRWQGHKKSKPGVRLTR